MNIRAVAGINMRLICYEIVCCLVYESGNAHLLIFLYRGKCAMLLPPDDLKKLFQFFIGFYPF